MAEPLVSVVLPTHNRPRWLAEALNSVLAGQFQDFEVVVSNNGDPAHTRELARTVADPRVHWLEQDQSTPALEHFLLALSQARGRYVAVLHDDDSWRPGFLAALVPALEARADAVLAFTDHNVVNAEGRIDAEVTERNSRRWGRTGLAIGFHHPFFEFAARQTVALSGAVIRHDALDVSELTPEVGPFHDVWITYQLARTGGAAYYHDERLSDGRWHDTSDTSTLDPTGHVCAIRCRTRMLADPRMQPYADVLRERLAQDHLSLGGKLLRLGNRREARTHLSTSARLVPGWKAGGGLVASWLAPSRVLQRL